MAFGDISAETDRIDDAVISNNHDRDLVLATVGNTIFDFTNHYGNHYIYATGSTTPRTQLYQIGIAGLSTEINKDLRYMVL